MALTLYDVTRVGLRGARCPVLQRVGYTSKIGPAFIWSAEFSEDGKALILGCWSGVAFVYTIDSERAKQVAAAAWSADEAAAAAAAAAAADADADADADAGTGVASASQARAEAPASEPTSGPPVLTQAAAVDRGERVYAVDCNADASRLVVGGRDKKVAMFDTERHLGGAHSGSARAEAPPMLWEVVSEDFVYCCSLSADFQYCAYGGTAGSYP